MPICGRFVERRLPMLRLKIHVTARSKELPYDGSVSLCGREVERRVPNIRLKIDVTSRSNKLRCHGRMPISCRAVERRVPMRVLVVDKGLRALIRQQRANLCCVTNTSGLEKLLPRHGFPAASICSLSLVTCNLYGPTVRPCHALIGKQEVPICQGTNM
jgi:hypothetical protein